MITEIVDLFKEKIENAFTDEDFANIEIYTDYDTRFKNKVIKDFKEKGFDIAEELNKTDITEELNTVKKLVAERKETISKNPLLNRVATVRTSAQNEEKQKYDWITAYDIELVHDVSELPKYIPTGYKKLDNALGSGLREGLYNISAVTGMGKTTFLLNIAKNLAKQGYNTLYFSVEMNPKDLRDKLLSILAYKTGNTFKINDIAVLNKEDPAQKERLQRANRVREEEKEVLKRISFLSPKQTSTMNYIRKTTEDYMAATQQKPIVMVDYLQLLETDIKTDERQSVNKVVKGLNKLAVDYGLTIIAITSINREGYKLNANISSAKESGNIEYSVGYSIGLDYNQQGAADPLNLIAEENAKKERTVYLRLPKTRFSLNENSAIPFTYIAEYGVFIEK